MSRPLEEYEVATMELYGIVFRKLMQIHEPFLGAIQHETVDYLSKNPTPPGVCHGQSQGAIDTSAEFSIPNEAALRLSVDAWVKALSDGARAALRSFMPEVFSRMRQVADAAGTAVDAVGTPISHDVLLDLLASVDFEVDERGLPKDMLFVAPPQVVASIAKLPPQTDAQFARFRQIMEKKREQQNARKRVRKLD